MVLEIHRGYIRSDISAMLPIDAYLKDFSLIWEQRITDPVYLLDHAGHELHV